jgi:hypothetical protein
MLVPDFMHEFELGVFKASFIHLLRILHAHGDGAISSPQRTVSLVKSRWQLGVNTYSFRRIPIFGRSTIRRFTLNTLALKKLAAWNYQCILLVRT